MNSGPAHAEARRFPLKGTGAWSGWGFLFLLSIPPHFPFSTVTHKDLRRLDNDERRHIIYQDFYR